jgi:hemolysin III
MSASVEVAGADAPESAAANAAAIAVPDQLSPVKPLWRGWLHLIWFEISLAAGSVLVTLAVGGVRTACAVVYASSVSALFGTSALYHRGSWRPKIASRMQRLDHAMIFILIAGTSTPLFVLIVPDPLRTVMLIAIWALAGSAMIVHLCWMSAPEVLVGGTYIVLGCVGVVALPYTLEHAGTAVFVLILAGGLLYIAGAVQYHVRWPDPRPEVFGYHEVFHCFVCVAAAAQYVAIATVLT